MSGMFVARDFEAGLYPAPVVDGMAVAWLEFTVVAEIDRPVDRFPVTVSLVGSRISVEGAPFWGVDGGQWHGRIGLVPRMYGRGVATDLRGKIRLERQLVRGLMCEGEGIVWALRPCGDFRQEDPGLVAGVSFVDCGFVVELPSLEARR